MTPPLLALPPPFPVAFYDRDPRSVARELLGAMIECRTPAGIASGCIVETEAYLGPHDPACHAVAGRTRRTWHLHGPPGRAYVYRIYGMHWCFNAVTLPEGIGSAVLVRALAPLGDLALIRTRRPGIRRDPDLTNGPGKLCAALGVDGRLDGVPLDGPPLANHPRDGSQPAKDAAEDRDPRTLVLRPGSAVPDEQVIVTPRIGITRAAEWPLRYLLRESPFVSRTPSGFFRRPYEPGVDVV
ncbi:MAG: DNA-3-methyladenine glycosylase [Candidatus Eremiobacteraeota bacterium]|nr:DNA-3-methyladenine glycosylase [Candidatus Eremiobacteraeota bacterium]